MNEKLSSDRANSVLKYLVEHGIDATRLAAQGFGPRFPIGDNQTAEGRQKNRRVEFHIRNPGAAKPSGTPPPVEPVPVEPPPAPQ
jgi:outer membrane protein OmpA-like peptidoglycan-associated protein